MLAQGGAQGKAKLQGSHLSTAGLLRTRNSVHELHATMHATCTGVLGSGRGRAPGRAALAAPSTQPRPDPEEIELLF